MPTTLPSAATSKNLWLVLNQFPKDLQTLIHKDLIHKDKVQFA